jgi:hypothetical protein
MTMNCEIAPVQGFSVAVTLCGIEVPCVKIDLKLMTKKVDITSTASYVNNILWEEFTPGASGATLSFDSVWRIGQVVTPPSVRVGAIYPAQVFVRRAATNGPSDPGSFYSFNVFVDDSALTLDPLQGKIDWKFSGTVTGAVTYPA